LGYGYQEYILNEKGLRPKENMLFNNKPDHLGVIEDWDDFNLTSEEEKHLLQNHIDLNEDSIIESMNDKWRDQ
jgi:hypothetical protein